MLESQQLRISESVVPSKNINFSLILAQVAEIELIWIVLYCILFVEVNVRFCFLQNIANFQVRLTFLRLSSYISVQKEVKEDSEC